MSKVYKDFIEYNGINIDHRSTFKNFNQVNIDYNFRISDEKREIESINKVWVDAHIDYSEVIKTPIGKSLNGQISTGYKLLVSGDIDIKIEYYSAGSIEVMNIVQGNFPFSNYITLPRDFDIMSIVLPYVYIEDMFCEILNSRTIYNNASLILVADIG
ncbi:SPOCS domain-containing protein [Paraclostridium dentum]|uniref:SPOCS domain-containing protein n=1 Tax=Paraclostridium dentum TaxID=2662455 RepID=UPI003F3DCF5F